MYFPRCPCSTPALGHTPVVRSLVSTALVVSLDLLAPGCYDSHRRLERSDGGAPIDARRVDASDGGRLRDVAIVTPGCTIPFEATVHGQITFTTDDQTELFVHGVLLDDTPRVWSEMVVRSMPVLVHPSHPNVIAIHGINTAEIDGRDRGVSADLSYVIDGVTHHVVTDLSWRLSRSELAGWTEADFDDGAFVTPVDEGPHGIVPWGTVLVGETTARWLWSYDSNLPASAKPTEEHVFLRRVFFVGPDGAPSDVPLPCDR